VLRVIWCGVLALSSIGIPVQVQAKGVLYDCDITEKRQGVGWISDKMAIVVMQNGRVVVSDAVILQFNRQPMQVRVGRNTDRKLVIRWTLNNVVNGSNQTTPAFEYSATLKKATNEIAVYANPDGYPTRFSGKGRCTLRHG